MPPCSPRTEDRGPRIATFSAAAVLLIAIVAFAFNWPSDVAWYEFRQQFERVPDNEQG